MVYGVCVAAAWLIWHIVFRIQVVGKENLKKITSSGFIIAPNHVSAIDPVFVVTARFWGRKMIVFAKKELFEIHPFLSWLFRQWGAVVVRGTRDEVEVLNDTIRQCKEGRGLLIFPEGTREKEGKLLQPKSGMFVVASQAQVDVIPCRILYGTPDGRMKPFCRVRVVFGQPIPAAELAMEGRRDVKALRAHRQRLLDAWVQMGEANAFAGCAVAQNETQTQ